MHFFRFLKTILLGCTVNDWGTWIMCISEATGSKIVSRSEGYFQLYYCGPYIFLGIAALGISTRASLLYSSTHTCSIGSSNLPTQLLTLITQCIQILPKLSWPNNWGIIEMSLEVIGSMLYTLEHQVLNLVAVQFLPSSSCTRLLSA